MKSNLFVSGIFILLVIVAVGCKKGSGPGPNPVVVQKPTIGNDSTYAILQTTAKMKINITSDGGGAITSRGVCISTSPGANLTNTVVSNGSGTGEFVVDISGLNPFTLYFMRSYATNSAGTTYGTEIDFRTKTLVTVSDCEGNIYSTVTIGTQTWMAENLRSTKYRDCSNIPEVSDNTAWGALTTGAWTVQLTPGYIFTYGRLYNWYAVNDPRNLAPAGWHVATESDWTTLVSFLGDLTTANTALKEAGTTHWTNASFPGTNSSGFTALPGSFRLGTGGFVTLPGSGYFWTATQYNASAGWYRGVSNSSTMLHQENLKTSGMSIRCIKD